jgi:hypothetical protein
MDAHARDYLTGVLKATGGERAKAAEIAGIRRTTMQALIKRFAIDIPKNPQATARCFCSRCETKTVSKGGKHIDDKFVCAACVRPTDEAPKTEAKGEPIRF